MIVLNESSGLRKRIGYKDLAKRYLEKYLVLAKDDFVVNMIFLIDEWEVEEGVRFEKIMPSDWEMLLKAIKVLNVEFTFVG